MSIIKTDPSIYFSKNDPFDIRLGDIAKSQYPEVKTWSLLGYPDDEGIRMNGGRAGAHLAPDSVRKFFYKMTPPSEKTQVAIQDIGNLHGLNLNNRHEEARLTVFNTLTTGHHLLTIGGGHDYGFSDTAGFLDWCKLNPKLGKPVVINLDAHLDVRPTDKGHHSGTPFRRLLEEFKGQFDFYEIGLQPQCNSPHHKKWAIENGATLFDIDSVEKIGILNIILENIEADKNRPIWLSIDIDAFSSTEAPGCSQSWTRGLKLQETLPVLHYLRNHFLFVGAGVYEVSPPLDQDDRTSKLAALLMYHLIFNI